MTEDEARQTFIFFTITLGTPWDTADQHLRWSGAMPREDFVFSGPGSLTLVITEAASHLEGALRLFLVPNFKEGDPDSYSDEIAQSD